MRLTESGAGALRGSGVAEPKMWLSRFGANRDRPSDRSPGAGRKLVSRPIAPIDVYRPRGGVKSQLTYGVLARDNLPFPRGNYGILIRNRL